MTLRELWKEIPEEYKDLPIVMSCDPEGNWYDSFGSWNVAYYLNGEIEYSDEDDVSGEYSLIISP
jgi:hypothetical protein